MKRWSLFFFHEYPMVYSVMWDSSDLSNIKLWTSRSDHKVTKYLLLKWTIRKGKIMNKCQLFSLNFVATADEMKTKQNISICIIHTKNINNYLVKMYQPVQFGKFICSDSKLNTGAKSTSISLCSIIKCNVIAVPWTFVKTFLTKYGRLCVNCKTACWNMLKNHFFTSPGTKTNVSSLW